jgi:hypothetical protein
VGLLVPEMHLRCTREMPCMPRLKRQTTESAKNEMSSIEQPSSGLNLVSSLEKRLCKTT